MRVIIEINDGAYVGMEMDARSKGVAIVDVIESAVERIFGEGSVRIDEMSNNNNNQGWRASPR